MNLNSISPDTHGQLPRSRGNKTSCRLAVVTLVLFVSFFVLNPANGQTATTGETAAEEIAVGEGTIIGIRADKDIIIMKHGDIEGFMSAMTMGYPVASKALLEDLKPGDVIKFKIDTGHAKIIWLERLK